MKTDRLLQIKLSKIFSLSSLLVEELESKVLTKTKDTQEISEKAQELIELLDTILDRFYKHKEIKIGTHHLKLQNQIKYLFECEFKNYDKQQKQKLRERMKINK